MVPVVEDTGLFRHPGSKRKGDVGDLYQDDVRELIYRKYFKDNIHIIQ
jgi:hypothetical protein